MRDKTVNSWAIPAMFSGFAWLAVWYLINWLGPQVWIAAVGLVGVALMSAAVANLSEYLAERQQAAFDFRQSAVSRTPESILFQEARLLAAQSPELAAELAKRVGRPDLILFSSRQGRRPQIKLAGSDVTLQFALKVLSLSDEVNMAAQRNFGEGTYLYDPNHEMPDRQQWRQLNWLLAREGMATRYVPNEKTNTPPMWLPPWTPARILENWLLPSDLLEVFEPYLKIKDEGEA